MKSGLFIQLIVFSFIPIICFYGCANVPGDTREEQVETVEELVERTLSDLYLEEPKARKEIADSIGYVIMSNKILKIPIVGVGSGYGVAIKTKSNEEVYLKMTRFDIGGGLGARSVRPVLVFNNEEKFDDFIDGLWEVRVDLGALGRPLQVLGGPVGSAVDGQHATDAALGQAADDAVDARPLVGRVVRVAWRHRRRGRGFR